MDKLRILFIIEWQHDQMKYRIILNYVTNLNDVYPLALQTLPR